jgi:branched-chain amino acid transport system permease protein
MGDSGGRLESQFEAAQEATSGSPQEGGPRWNRRFGQQRGRDLAGQTAPQGLRDRVAAGYKRLPKPAQLGLWAVVFALFALVPALMPYITNDTGYWTLVLVNIGIAALLALGLNVVVGFAGLLDLGYVAFFAVGAYTFALLSGAARYSVAIQALDPNAPSLQPHWQMYMWLYFFVALGVAILAGVVLGAPTLRLRGDYLAIVTLGFGEIVRITANNLGSIEGGPRGVLNIPHPEIHIGGYHYLFGLNSEAYYWLLLVVIAVWIFLLRRINDSRIGRSWAAIREDELAAAAMGIPTIRMKLLAFAIGAAVASFAGVIYASQSSFISPDTFALFNMTFGSVTILAMVVIGGMGGIAGPILGAFLIIFLPERLRWLGDSRVLVFGAALVLIMIFRPQGLLPSRRRSAELTGGEIHDTTVYEVQHGGGT